MPKRSKQKMKLQEKEKKEKAVTYDGYYKIPQRSEANSLF